MTSNQKVLAVVGGIVGAMVLMTGVAYVATNTDFSFTNKNKPEPGWTLVSTADDGALWVVNDSSINVEDNRYVQAWIMESFDRRQKDGTQSTKLLTIVDCQTRQYMFTSGASTDGPMGHGAGVSVIGKTPVRSAPPGTNIAHTVDYVCQAIRPVSDSQPAVNSKPLTEI